MKTGTIFILFVLLSMLCNAQLINVHTYPVLSDGGGGIPMISEAMGGVSIAYRDGMRDALVNPAAILFTNSNILTTGPRYSSWKVTQSSTSLRSFPDGSQRKMTSYGRNSSKNYTIPIGLVQQYGSAGFSVTGSYQRYHSKISEHSTYEGNSGVNGSYRESYHGDYNASASVGFGMMIPGTDVAVGIGAEYSAIHATDALLFLYSNSANVEMFGKGWNVRAGAAGELPGVGELQFFGGYTAYKSDQAADQRFGERVENKDETNAWFVQTGIRKQVTDKLTIGLRLTGNLKDHPKIPEYPVAGIPRDPGTTHAVNAGFGMSWKTASDAVFAFEYEIEPVASETWVEAEEEITTNHGKTILPGEKEQQNDYTFLNHAIRAGAEFPLDSWLTFRFGTELKMFSFDYHHENFRNNLVRDVESQNTWTEVTLTGGLFVKIGEMTMGYQAEMINGLGILEQSGSFFGPPAFSGNERNAVASPAADYLIPPNGNVQVRPIPVLAQRLTVSLPLNVFQRTDNTISP